MNKTKNGLGLGAIAFSFLFLFNPNVNIIDVFPDLIGYLILCVALTKLGDLNEGLYRAKELFARMIVIDAVKIVAVFWVFGLSFRDEQNTLLLLVSFALGVIELFTLIPAFIKLFEGLTALGYAHENTSVLGEGKHARVSEQVRSFTLFFIVFKVVMSVLPEFTVFGTQSYDEVTGFVNIYDFAPLLRSLAVMVTLVLGVVWLVKITGYFRRIKKDRAFVNSLSERYSEKVLPRESIFIQRKIKLAFLLIGAFCLLCIDFRIDSFNVIPDTAASLLLILMVFIIKKYVSRFKGALLCFSAYAVTSLASIIVEYRFFDEYYYAAVIRSEEAYLHYVTMLSFSALDTVGFLLAVLGLLLLLKDIISKYTGFVMSGVTQNEEAVLGALHKELNKKLWLVAFFAILCAASDIAYDFLARKYGVVGIINLACTVIFIISVFSTLFSIYEEVESKYLLD